VYEAVTPEGVLTPDQSPTTYVSAGDYFGFGNFVTSSDGSSFGVGAPVPVPASSLSGHQTTTTLVAQDLTAGTLVDMAPVVPQGHVGEPSAYHMQ
jgi:hypothetical protein